MKLLPLRILLLAIFINTAAFSQSIPELVFQNPAWVPTSAPAGTDGAVYKFSNVATGIDATVKITRRSSASVQLTNIDVSNMGWNKAFQPQVGIPGNVPANQTWWMEFEMTFFKAGTSTKKKIDEFVVTSIDTDGDGWTIREFLQMNDVKSVKYCPVTYLVSGTPYAWSSSDDDDDDNDHDSNEKNVLVQGPVQNFIDIDTLSTPTMATYTYSKKSSITFMIGAKSGANISNAGERLNSLWFKSFKLVVPGTLPVRLSAFTAAYDKKNVVLDWITEREESFSHYVVERSTDGKSYTDVATVAAASNTTLKSSYQYKDANLTSSTGMLYYRLRLVEKTNDVNYSQVRTVRLSGESESLKLAAYPNPVKDVVKLTLPQSWQGKKIQIDIYNSTGGKLQSVPISAASQTESLNMGGMANGVYVVTVKCDDRTLQERIVKN